ncbi:MAG: hypothetical protein N3F10_06220 [Candidatus Bathyarchaeota archaeon]|nr:hypothetical protein [Candidatus Bathyarchaeota archaeon]MCX8177871.1 hypothetical protein [Candidatus Bathyarchaeota archaeon]MDW8193592.1 hypothetical protein [Nitrososphaerota archaeon]
MMLPCEVAVKILIPPTRAAIAKELIMRHGLKQAEAARLLGVSQPAISLYNRRMRGKAINLEDDLEIRKLIVEFADNLARKSFSQRDYILRFCEICKKARAKKLLCKMHKSLDSSFDVDNCDFCAEALKCL